MATVGVPVVDLPTFCFLKGISIDNVILDLTDFKPRGYCYCGFREMPPSMRGVAGRLSGKKLLMVRDPRDMIVSLYYSVKFSHYFPDQGTAQFFQSMNTVRAATQEPIDRFCLSNIDLYLHWFRGYSELLNDSSVSVVRYEDIIYDKAELARRICGLFSLDISEASLNESVEPFRVVPDQENPQVHLRQVHPGDHRRKLQHRTVEILSEMLEKFISRFDYAL